MRHKKSFVVPFKDLGFMINRDVQFLFKISTHPHIMIADKKMNRNSTVCYFSKFAKQPYITFWNNSFILVPKIKHIAKDKNLLSIVANKFQKIYYFFFADKTACVIRDSKVKIGNEINFFTGCKVHFYTLFFS